MKTTFLLSFLIAGQVVLGQQEQLTKVPGTKCSLVPPVGFVTATTFSGFQNVEKGASIMVNELPGAYQSFIDEFQAGAFTSMGMTITSKQTIDFNKRKATLINVTQPGNGTTYIKQMLIFGDSSGTVLVNGIYPEASKDLEVEIKKALLTTVQSISQNDNPLDAATFTIDVKNTDFKLIRYMSGHLLYSTDGKIPTEKPTLVVGNSIASVPGLNRREYAEERLRKLPGGERSVTREIQEITVDHLKGYEIVADGKTSNDKDELVYQVILFNDDGSYYLIVGQAREEFQKNVESYKKITRTFKRK